jgi:hypothetical protein
MTVSTKPEATVCIPWRPSPSRIPIFERVMAFWEQVGWPVVTADSDTEIFSLAQARNNAVRKARTEVVVICDADTIPVLDNVRAAVADPQQCVCWPFTHYRILSTDYLYTPFDQLDRAPYMTTSWDGDGVNGVGGCLVATQTEYWRLGGQPPEFCVDEPTEILTSQGWKRYTDITIGEPVLTLNHDTAMSEWKPLQRVNVYPGSREMVGIESKTHSSLSTMDHRWPVERNWNVRQVGKRSFRRTRRTWTTTGTFQQQDYVPTAAHCSDLPTEPKYTDAFVELVGWFWTEGCISRNRDGSRARTVSISQSVTVNPDHCERIRSALRRSLGPPIGAQRRSGRSPEVPPAWRETRAGQTAIFNLNAEAGALVQSCAPNRVVTHEFLISLTQSQLESFIQTSLWADGHTRTRSYEQQLAQKNQAAAESFQFACILAGYATSSVTRPVMTKYGYGMTVVSIRRQRRFMLSKGTHTRHQVEGIVWCPTTENGTWLARRNGKVYFTGNCGWGWEDTAFTAIVQTLSRLKRIEGNVYAFEHNTNAGEYHDAKADSPGWDRDIARNEALMKPYRNANGRQWLMRHILALREAGERPLVDYGFPVGH